MTVLSFDEVVAVTGLLNRQPMASRVKFGRAGDGRLTVTLEQGDLHLHYVSNGRVMVLVNSHQAEPGRAAK